MAEVSGRCTIEYPKVPDRVSYIPRSAHQMDAEDARAMAPLFDFVLCEFGELLKSLAVGFAEPRQRGYSLFEKPMP